MVTVFTRFVERCSLAGHSRSSISVLVVYGNHEGVYFFSPTPFALANKDERMMLNVS